MYEKILFLMALAGSAVYLLEWLAARVQAMFPKRPAVIPVTKSQKLEESSKKEPSLESPTKPDDLKALIELLAAQGEEMANMSRLIAEANDRLAALETPKTKATRKARVVSCESGRLERAQPTMRRAYRSITAVR